MAHDTPMARRVFLETLGAVGVAIGTKASLLRITRAGPDDPEIPNEEVRRILTERFQNRPITRGHVTLEMPAVAEDGRYVPVSIASDLPMTPEQFVSGVFLIVDHNPDPLVTAFHLSPAFGPLAIQTRIKLKRTTWIRAIVETNGGAVWADYLKVETALNGCG